MADADTSLLAAVQRLRGQVDEPGELRAAAGVAGSGTPTSAGVDTAVRDWVFDVAGKVAGVVDEAQLAAGDKVTCALVAPPDHGAAPPASGGAVPSASGGAVPPPDAKDLVAEVCASFAAGASDVSLQICAAIIITHPKPRPEPETGAGAA